MEIRVLGGVEVLRDGVPVNAGYPRQRSVLAILAVETGRLVSVDALINHVWDDGAPPSAATSLQSYISRARQLFDGVAGISIDWRTSGYVLNADPEIVDLHRFRGLITKAQSTTDDSDACRLYQEAFGLWRGEAFTGMSTVWFDDVRTRLAAEYHQAHLDHNDVLLRLERHAELTARLPGAVRDHPLDERLVGQLMLALFRSGRQADALEHYTRLHNRLVDELGNDPGPELRELYRRIIVGDASPPGPKTTTAPVPRQLPGAPRRFTGRDKELGRLDAATDGAAPLWVIAGPGGIGKTWLVLHWANRLLDRFPDGQVYVNLHGFHPTEEPTGPGTALYQVLDALGVPAAAIPTDTEARAARYRSLLAGRRMLVILDNARDTEQVLPLLPGGRTCTTVITSRRDLPGLGAAHGASLIRLGILDDEQARQTLSGHVGAQRLAEEPAAIAELVERCEGLPLALGIIGARAATRDDFPLTALAEELRDHTDRLDLLDSGELGIGLRAVFDGSYRALNQDEAKLFDLLGPAPGRDVGVYAAASLAGLPLGRTRVLLRGLETASLIEQHRPGRYRMHDLTRLYAAERAVTDRAALRRLVVHYLRTASRMDELCLPTRHRVDHDPGEVVDGCLPVPLTDPDESREWLSAESATIASVQGIALENGWYTEVWRLAWCSTIVLWNLNYADDALAIWRKAREAAERLGDPRVDAIVGSFLGRALHVAGRSGEGVRHLSRALSYFDAIRDRPLQSMVLRHLARCHASMGDVRQALIVAQQALQLPREEVTPNKYASSLNAVGWYHALLGEFRAAHVHCEEALKVLTDAGAESVTTGDVLDSLGYIAYHSGHYAEAIDYHTRALEALRTRWTETVRATTYERLGDAHHATGADTAAHDAWRQALALYKSQYRPKDADNVAAKLATLTKQDA